MFGITKAERDRQKYIRDMRRLMGEVLNLSKREVAEQNQVWDEWLGFKSRRSRDLWELLKTDVKDAFKARAIAILLAPRMTFAPFRWPNDLSLSNYRVSGDNEMFCELSLLLQRFVVALLEINIDIVRASDAEDDLRQILCSYNRIILQALTVLSEDDPMAVRLFDRYQINDPVEFWNMEDSSGYNPFYDLLQATVPEKWKKLADEKMREVIRTEKEGRIQPRNDWEEALSQYLHHVQFCLYKDPFPYCVDLFASQVEFILGFSNTDDGQTRFEHYHAHAILAMLRGESRKELRHRFVRHMVLADDHSFEAYNEETYAASMVMFEEFGDTDQELSDRLRNIISEADARTRAERVAIHRRREQADAVMARMR